MGITTKTMGIITKGRLAFALALLAIYASAVTPLAYREARRMVIAWAAQQPDMPLGGGYTIADRDALLEMTKATGIAVTETEKKGGKK